MVPVSLGNLVDLCSDASEEECQKVSNRRQTPAASVVFTMMSSVWSLASSNELFAVGTGTAGIGSHLIMRDTCSCSTCAFHVFDVYPCRSPSASATSFRLRVIRHTRSPPCWTTNQYMTGSPGRRSRRTMGPVHDP